MNKRRRYQAKRRRAEKLLYQREYAHYWSMVRFVERVTFEKSVAMQEGDVLRHTTVIGGPSVRQAEVIDVTGFYDQHKTYETR